MNEINSELDSLLDDIDLTPDYPMKTVATMMGAAIQLRRVLSHRHTVHVLRWINHNSGEPLSNKDFYAFSQGYDKQIKVEIENLSRKILDYIKIVESASIWDIKDYCKEERKPIEEAIEKLTEEGWLVKHRKEYKLIKKIDWNDMIGDLGATIPYNVPYFHPRAYFCQSDIILVGATTGSGKCHRKGTKIIMYDGTLKNVETIDANDLVMGIDSTARKVERIGRGYGQMFEIKPNKGDSFFVNYDHILCLQKTGTKEKIEISVKDYLTKSKNFKHLYKIYINGVDFEDKDLPIEPYFLGLWLGDGDKTNPRITTKDNEIIEYLTYYAKRLDLQLSTYKGECNSYAITRGYTGGANSGKTLHEKMVKLGVMGNKHIPKIYQINSRKNRLELLAGLVDSDGSLIRGNFEITLVNKKLAEQVCFLARSLGFMVTFKKRVCTIKSIGYLTVAYRMNIIGNCIEIPTRIKRKQASVRKINKNHQLSGFKIIPIGNENFYGFELSGKDSLYLLDSFWVNHNTHVAMNMILDFVRQGIKPYYVSTESGSRHARVARDLGLKDGDYFWADIVSATDIPIEPNAVTIIDWLLPTDYAETDKLFQHFAHKMAKSSGLLIIFMQLRKDGNWFAENLCTMFPSFAAKYTLNSDRDGGAFKIDKIRESKEKDSYRDINGTYNWHDKTLIAIDDDPGVKEVMKEFEGSVGNDKQP